MVVVVPDVALARGVEAGRADAQELHGGGAVERSHDFQRLPHHVRDPAHGRLDLDDVFCVLVHRDHAIVGAVLAHDLQAGHEAGQVVRTARKDVGHRGLEDQLRELAHEAVHAVAVGLEVQNVVPQNLGLRDAQKIVRGLKQQRRFIGVDADEARGMDFLPQHPPRLGNVVIFLERVG